MIRRLLILTAAMGLTACESGGSRVALSAPTPAPAPAVHSAPQPAPQPADGLWAMLDPGCPKPSLINVGAWPKCASPFWISRGSAVVVRTKAARSGRAINHSYRAGFSLSGADPLIAQVGNAKDGYLFLALTKLAHDDQGRVIAATGAAVACPGPADGAISLTPTAGGCEAASADGVREAARATLLDQSLLTRVAWIADGTPVP